MTIFRFGRTQKAISLVPLAALSTAWTVSLVGTGGQAALASGQEEQAAGALPDGTSVPTQAIEAPASVSRDFTGDRGAIVRTASTNGIPDAALSAYQRAETIINAADKSCNVPWQLIAAIGRVESDHGRYGGNSLDGNGVARPGIYGIPLTGKNDTAAIRDTDAGQYDRDQVWDRAVGPMQFIPSTWSVVGVDADGDAERNPQDIDDAALATAVYLCSGNDDLSTEAGQREAVFRYNHSNEYVDLVLSIMEAYMSGDFMTVPNGTTSAGYYVPDPSYVPPAQRGPRKGKGGPAGGGSVAVSNGGGGQNSGGTSTAPADEPVVTAPEPDDDTLDAPTGGNLKDTVDGTVKDTRDAVKDTTDTVKDTVDNVTKDPGGTVKDTITRAEASAKCLAKVGVSSLAQLDLLGLLKKQAYDACMADFGY